MGRGQIANYFIHKSKAPVIGDGVTIFSYTDRSAGTVEKISKSGKTIWIRPDKAVRVDDNGMSESQRYTYEPMKEAKLIRASLRKTGEWRLSGPFQNKMAIGYKDAYHDYSF